MIDLHCHFLPGIDDGPDTLEQSLELARIAVKDGISHSVVTPHIHPGRWENTRATILDAVEQFRAELQKHEIPLQLGFAGEVRITDQIFTQLEMNQLPFYGSYHGKKVLLLEFPHGQLIPGSDKLMKWLLNKDIQPVIAHPERNKDVMRSPALIEPFVETGCFLQVTAGSLTGRFGERAQQVAEQLLLDDVITFVATDAHNRKTRPPLLSEARERISQLVDADKAQQLVYKTPRELIQDQFADLI